MPKLRSSVFLLLIVALAWPAAIARAGLVAEVVLAPEAPLIEWQQIRPGIEYTKVHLTSPRPIDLFIARMNRAVTSATVDTEIAMGKLSSGVETVQSMAARADHAVNYADKVWGQRNDVAVAINGYYFNQTVSPQGYPISGLINSGWYSTRYLDFTADMGPVWTLNRQAHIGDCVYHKANKQTVTYLETGAIQNFNGLNRARGEDELVIYTPQWDGFTSTDSSGIEVLVELSTPLGLKGTNVGVIRQIRDRQGNTLIPFDHIILSATGSARDKLKSNAAVGDQIRIAQEISTCGELEYFDYTNSYGGLGGDYHFLSNGVIRTDFGNPDAGVPNSRTAVGFNDDHVFFIVADCWKEGVSQGITIQELATYFAGMLGAEWGVSLDSGGSSTMVVNGSVVNNAAGNYAVNCYTVNDSQNRNIPVEAEPSTNVPEQVMEGEPAVGDAMVMVNVLPRQLSTTFLPGLAVLTKVELGTALRLGPGEDYGRIITVPLGTQGVIVSHGGGLNGVRAKGGDAYNSPDAFWWKASFLGQTGWVREDALVGGQVPGSEESPISGLTVSSDAPTELGQPTNFQASFDDGSNVILNWDFGDGSSVENGPAAISHIYSSTGVYNVVLTASNPLGSQSVSTQVPVIFVSERVRLPIIQR